MAVNFPVRFNVPFDRRVFAATAAFDALMQRPLLHSVQQVMSHCN